MMDLLFGFLGLLRSVDMRVRRAQPFHDQRQSEHQLFVYNYAKFSTLFGIDNWRSIDPPSQVKKKFNFFLIFIAKD